MATRISNKEKARGAQTFECCLLRLAPDSKSRPCDWITATIRGRAKPPDAISLAFINQLAGLLEIFPEYRFAGHPILRKQRLAR